MHIVTMSRILEISTKPVNLKIIILKFSYWNVINIFIILVWVSPYHNSDEFNLTSLTQSDFWFKGRAKKCTYLNHTLVKRYPSDAARSRLKRLNKLIGSRQMLLHRRAVSIK